MLKRTFCHAPSVGVITEDKIWQAGISSWEEFAHNEAPIAEKKSASIVTTLDESFKRLKAHDARYFSKLLPSGELWRLFKHFRSQVAYLDIETTGLAPPDDFITCISIYDGKEILYYVRGENLDDFPADIDKYDLLVTFNGKCFDIPFIEKAFNIELDQAHIDLRFLLKSLGFTGGLKKIEKALNINRGALDGVDGYFAVLLWDDYQRTGNKKSLETLLAYNIEDTVNLEMLMVRAYNMKLETTPFKEEQRVEIFEPPKLPFEADMDTIERIAERYNGLDR